MRAAFCNTDALNLCTLPHFVKVLIFTLDGETLHFARTLVGPSGVVAKTRHSVADLNNENTHGINPFWASCFRLKQTWGEGDINWLSNQTLFHDFNLGLAHPQPQPSQVEFMYGANPNS